MFLCVRVCTASFYGLPWQCLRLKHQQWRSAFCQPLVFCSDHFSSLFFVLSRSSTFALFLLSFFSVCCSSFLSLSICCSPLTWRTWTNFRQCKLIDFEKGTDLTVTVRRHFRGHFRSRTTCMYMHTYIHAHVLC